jgi:urease accessory protein
VAAFGSVSGFENGQPWIGLHLARVPPILAANYIKALGVTMSRLALSLVAMLIATTTAHAHTGVGDTHGLVHGFAHPMGGIDHVLVMVAVGLFAAQLGGRALWLVPLSFVAMMAIGGGFGMAGVALPVAELGIVLSVVVLGVAVAARLHVPTVVAMMLVGFFALFHGHAHGAEMPSAASALVYGIGFVLGTASLHAAGIGLGLAAGKAGEVFGNRILKAAGSAMALAGVAILAGYL